MIRYKSIGGIGDISFGDDALLFTVDAALVLVVLNLLGDDCVVVVVVVDGP